MCHYYVLSYCVPPCLVAVHVHTKYDISEGDHDACLELSTSHILHVALGQKVNICNDIAVV